MILFYKQSSEQVNLEYSRLVKIFDGKSEIKVSDDLPDNRLEVVISSTPEDFSAAQEHSPYARHILSVADKFQYTSDEIIELVKNGLTFLVERSNTQEIVSKVSQAFNEKKNFDFYLKLEEPKQIDLKDSKLQIDGIINRHIVGNTAAVADMLRMVKVLMHYPKQDIFIRGENGVGKEMLVQVIKENANPKAFGILNMATSNPQIFSAKLFGVKKGAFTGADQNTKGLFEECDGGMIYMDEIGRTPKELQMELMRSMDNREYSSLGSTETKKFDCRILMATNANCQELVEQGKMEIDFLGRIEQMVIPIPPLRDRREDIPLLAGGFLKTINEQNPTIKKELADEAVELLRNLDWPNNIRQLKNTIARSHIIATQEQKTTINVDTIYRSVLAAEAKSISAPMSNMRKIVELAEKFKINLRVGQDNVETLKSNSLKI